MLICWSQSDVTHEERTCCHFQCNILYLIKTQLRERAVSFFFFSKDLFHYLIFMFIVDSTFYSMHSRIQLFPPHTLIAQGTLVCFMMWAPLCIVYVMFFLSWFTSFTQRKLLVVGNNGSPVPLLFSFHWNKWKPTLSEPEGMTLLCQSLLSSYSQTRSWEEWEMCRSLCWFEFLHLFPPEHTYSFFKKKSI